MTSDFLNDLSLEKQFAVRCYEVVILPSLPRELVAKEVLRHVYGQIMIQQEIQGLSDRISADDLLKFACVRTIVQNPKEKESRLRSLAIDAYVSYLRSKEIFESLTAKKGAK